MTTALAAMKAATWSNGSPLLNLPKRGVSGERKKEKDTPSKACPFFEFLYDFSFLFGTDVGEVC